MTRGATFYINYYEHNREYNLKQLQDYDRYARRDIERMEEEIEKIKEYRESIFKQSQIVLNTPMKTVVKVTRSHSERVYYYIAVYTTPKTEDLSDFYRHIVATKIYNERFPGTERHNVLKLATKLAEEHDAILIKNF